MMLWVWIVWIVCLLNNVNLEAEALIDPLYIPSSGL